MNRETRKERKREMVAIDYVADRGCHWNDGAADAADLRIILVATGGDGGLSLSLFVVCFVWSVV